MNILIAEDNMVIRMLQTKLMENWGFSGKSKGSDSIEIPAPAEFWGHGVIAL